MRASLFILILGLCGLPYSNPEQSFDFGLVTQPRTVLVNYVSETDKYLIWQYGDWGTTRRPVYKRTINRNLWTVKQDTVRIPCSGPCPRIYKKLAGPVCAHRLDYIYDPRYNGRWADAPVKGFIDWRLGGALDRTYDYLHTVKSYCEFLDLQCRTKIYHGVGYAFLHMGQCLRDEEVFPNATYGQSLRERKYDYVREKTEGQEHN